jgi:ABC-2 type transport system ATP-binding protein
MGQKADLAIEAQNLRRVYQKIEAVAGISFSVPRGTIFGLLGPNGAGKTTTIRMLTGQIDPTSGSGTVAGYNILKERKALKQHVGVVFEEQNLYERLSARRNLEFSCWLYGVPVKRIDEVLDLVHLRDRAKEPISGFSNGMRQRIMVARALIHQPDVLFLDEPSRGLDPVSARQVRDAIQDLSKTGITVLLTTHIMEEADALCNQLGFIVKGNLVVNDTPRNLKLAYGERILDVTLKGKPDEPITLKMDDSADQAKLASYFADGIVETIHSREATLEDIFFKLAGVRPGVEIEEKKKR